MLSLLSPVFITMLTRCLLSIYSVVVALEDVFLQENRTSEEARKELQSALAAISTPTAKEDFVTHMRNELVLRTARKLGYKQQH